MTCCDVCVCADCCAGALSNVRGQNLPHVRHGPHTCVMRYDTVRVLSLLGVAIKQLYSREYVKTSEACREHVTCNKKRASPSGEVALSLRLTMSMTNEYLRLRNQPLFGNSALDIDLSF